MFTLPNTDTNKNVVIKDLTGCSGVFTLRSTDIDKKLGFIEVHVRVHSAQGQVLTQIPIGFCAHFSASVPTRQSQCERTVSGSSLSARPCVARKVSPG